MNEVECLKSRKTMAFIVPCYNEEDCIEETAGILIGMIFRLIECCEIGADSRILFVDDGSSDKTWQIVTQLAKTSDFVSGLKLSRSFGHQNALVAGLHEFTGDFCISIDADLQDDVSVIPEMIRKYHEGCQVVYGQREARKDDTVFKRNTARLYYKLLASLGIESVQNHADFRLMSREAVDRFKLFGETNMFVRGVVPLIGLKSEIVSYDRLPRTRGETKYSLNKMFSLGLSGVVSFTSKPLYLISFIGCLVSLGAVALAVWALGVRFFSDAAVPGWASTVIPIYFIGGVQLFSIGLLGVYVSRIFEETKKRPRYIIEKTTCRAGKN